MSFSLDDKKDRRHSVTIPISNQQNVHTAETQPAARPAPATPAAKPPADSVQLSPQAKAALTAGDVDHDGDSR
jgi:hypothetical protein